MLTTRLLFLNCYLLRVLEWPARRPLVTLGSKPDIDGRALELSRLLAGSYEVACLAEVFDRRDVTTLSTPPSGVGPQTIVGPEPTGPAARLRRSSGLVDLVDGPRVVKVRRHRFERSGSRLHDPDAHATKGALFLEVDVGAEANLEIVSTHLIAGGDLVPRKIGPLPGPEDGGDNILRMLRQAQVAELGLFVARHHSPGNATLFVGDFNVPRWTGEPGTDAPAYSELVRGLGGPVDVWDTYGPGGHGATSDLADSSLADAFHPDPDDPRFFEDSGDLPSSAEAAQRIDHAFLATDDRCRLPISQVRIRRRRLPYADPKSTGLAWCSDHVGLHIELDIHA